MRTISDPLAALRPAFLTGLGLLLAVGQVAVADDSLVTITTIRSELRADGTTQVTISADQILAPRAWRRSRIPGARPRAVLKLRAVGRPYQQELITVDDVNLRRIRVGHHPEYASPELHLVFDLADPEVEIVDILQVDETIIVEIARPAATAHATPYGDDPAPATIPTPVPVIHDGGTEASAADDPNPALNEAPLPLLTHIESRHGDGVTVVELVADTPFAARSVGQLYLAGNQPRQVVSLAGYGLGPTVGGRIAVGDGVLNEIRLTPYPEWQPTAIHVTLKLSGPAVRVLDITQEESTITVRLAAN